MLRRADLQLYLAILREKNDNAAVLALLSSEMGQQIYKVETDRQRELMRVQQRLGHWDAVQHIVEPLLESSW